jgi:serine/threonine-protein kinase RsbW
MRGNARARPRARRAERPRGSLLVRRRDRGAAKVNELTERLEPDRLFISLSAERENLGAVREAVDRAARGFGMPEQARNDLKTLVSEACANAVLHAYADDAIERPLEIEMTRQEEAVEIVVRDRGQGVSARPDPKPASLRLGLLLVGAMASSFRLCSVRGAGTELRATVALAA